MARALAAGAFVVLGVGVAACSSSASNPSGASGDAAAPGSDAGATDATLTDGAVDQGSDASEVGDAGPGGDSGITDATFTIDLTAGPARQFQPPAQPVLISPYVYGINGFAAWNDTTKWGITRSGGDAFTDWNWTNNYSNSAADYCFWQGQEAGGAALAGWITATGLSIPTAQSLGTAYLATVPIVDYVSAAFVNNTGINNLCPGTPSCSGGSSNGYAMNTGNLSFASQNPASTAFVANNPKKPSAFCTCQPGATCASGCTVSASGPVYEDELVNFLRVTYGSGAAPIFFSLDNEPNYWPSTHPEVWPFTGTLGCGTSGTVSFDDVVNRDSTYAAPIKAAWPQTKVFGPVVAQDGLIYAGDYSDPNLPTPFVDYYLGKMAATAEAGTPLIDVFDYHYYAVGTGAQCVQVPRMFWDPSFTAFSAATTDSIDFGWSGQNNYFDTALYPRQMIPRLLGKIATAYAGQSTTLPGLSFSEYNAGCETQIEGGVAEADLLGIFGREGVFSATAWPLKAILNGSSLANFLVAAYDLYRNYDGAGTVVGDTTVFAQTADLDDTSVYAFTHSSGVQGAEVVALNKTSAAMPVTVEIAHAPSLTTATAYELVAAQVKVVAVAGTTAVTCASGSCRLAYTLPALSATTLVLR